MKTLPTAHIPTNQLAELDKFANSSVGPELRDVLLSISQCVRAGNDVVVDDGSTTLTPTQVAERLSMSRTHLYKLLDRGEIVSHRVGRDRRIRICDLIEFEERRQRDRRELAERFAHQHETTGAAVDEIADQL